jgi:hypothetical protein
MVKQICTCNETIAVMCKIPASHSHSGKAFKKLCAIDKCVVPLIQALQKSGFITTGCCCGHGATGSILLDDGTELIIVWPWINPDVNKAGK